MALLSSLGRVMADTGEVMDKNEKKELNVKIMENEFAAVETVQTTLMGVSILMCVNVKNIHFRQQFQVAR